VKVFSYAPALEVRRMSGRPFSLPVPRFGRRRFGRVRLPVSEDQVARRGKCRHGRVAPRSVAGAGPFRERVWLVVDEDGSLWPTGLPGRMLKAEPNPPAAQLVRGLEWVVLVWF